MLEDSFVEMCTNSALSILRNSNNKKMATPTNTEMTAMQIHHADVKRKKKKKERNFAGSYLQSAIKRRPIKGGDDKKEATEWRCG